MGKEWLGCRLHKSSRSTFGELDALALLVQRKVNGVRVCDSKSALPSLSSPRPGCNRVVQEMTRESQLAIGRDVSSQLLSGYRKNIYLAAHSMTVLRRSIERASQLYIQYHEHTLSIVVTRIVVVGLWCVDNAVRARQCGGSPKQRMCLTTSLVNCLTVLMPTPLTIIALSAPLLQIRYHRDSICFSYVPISLDMTTLV